jgi:hypothetical protein
MSILIRFSKFCGNFFGKISLHCTPKRRVKSILHRAYRDYQSTDFVETLNSLGFTDDEARAVLRFWDGVVSHE